MLESIHAIHRKEGPNHDGSVFRMSGSPAYPEVVIVLTVSEAIISLTLLMESRNVSIMNLLWLVRPSGGRHDNVASMTIRDVNFVVSLEDDAHRFLSWWFLVKNIICAIQKLWHRCKEPRVDLVFSIGALTLRPGIMGVELVRDVQWYLTCQLGANSFGTENDKALGGRFRVMGGLFHR